MTNSRARGARGADFAAVAALFILSAVYFHPFWLHGRVFMPADFLFNQRPWAGEARGLPEAVNPEPSDAVQQHYPWRAFYARSIRDGIVPLWNPHQFCGQPFAANDQSAVFYPLNAVFYRLFRPPVAYTLLGWLHLWLGGAFMYLLLRYARAGVWGGLAGAVVFMFNGCHTVWMEHAAKQAAMAWTPLVVLLAGVAARRRCVFAAAALCSAAAVQLTAGFLQYSMYSFTAAGAFALFCGYFPRGRAAGRFPFAAVAGLVFAFVVAAGHVAPVLELAGVSGRPHVAPHGLWFPGVPLKNVGNIVFPDAFGSPLDASRGAGLNYTETNFFLGAPAVVFAGVCVLFLVAGLMKRGGRWGRLSGADGPRAGTYYSYCAFFAALCAFSFAAMLGSPVYAPYYYLVPGAKSLVVGRIGYLFTFSAAALAGLGVCGICAAASRRAAAAVGVVCLVCVGGAMMPWSMRFNAFSAGDLVFRRTGVEGYIRERGGWWRLASGDSEWMMFPDTATALGLDDVRGYDSLYPVWSRELMREIQRHWGGVAAERPTTISDAPAVLYAAPYGWMNVRYALSGVKADWPLGPAAEVNGTYIYENARALPRAFFTKGWRVEGDGRAVLRHVVSPEYRPLRECVVGREPVFAGGAWPAARRGKSEYSIAALAPGLVSLDVETSENALLFVSETYYPGWRAEAGGRRLDVLRANYSFMAVAAPAGKYNLTLRFSPVTALAGFAVSLAGLAVCGVAMIAARGMGKRS